MTFFWAGLSAFAAGVLFRTESSIWRTPNTIWFLLLRVVALIVMVVAAFLATPLFGGEGTKQAMGIAAAVLWLPQFLIMLIFLGDRRK